METSEFQKWLARIDELTPIQRNRAIEALGSDAKDGESVAIIEGLVSDDRRCPQCNKPGAIRRGIVDGLQRYSCNHCRRTFNAITGTSVSGLRKKDKWLKYCEALKEGLTLEKAAEHCGIHPRTAFRWRHRFLKLFSDNKSTKLNGIVEADETFFLESCKGQKELPRPARQRGEKATRPGLSGEQIPVLIARDRSGETFDAVLEGLSKEQLGAALKPVLGNDVLLCTDGSRAFKAMAKDAEIEHQAVNLKAGIRVKDHVYHVQNVNAYDSRLKGWLRRFNGVATRYLGSYLGWRRFIDCHPEDASNPKSWLIEALRPVPA
mgnify:CR=1 FL=1